MNKKGFTLIELLAVVVILAIIAIIAVPTLTRVIDKSKRGAAEVSARNYLDAVEKYIILHDVSPDKYPYNLTGKTLNVADNNEIALLDIIIPKAKAENSIPALNNILTVKGDKPKSGTVTIDDKGKASNANLVINDYAVECKNYTCTSRLNNKVILSYNLDGGTLNKTNDSVTKGSTFELPIPTKGKYEFMGWYTEKDGKGTKVDEKTIFKEDMNLYAFWAMPIANIDQSEYINYIGSQVRYNGDSDWSILYIGDDFASDGVHMYLISKTNRWTGKPIANGTYANSVLNQQSGDKLLSWADSYKSSNSNSNGASKTWSMLTPSNYTEYFDTKVADWAIGGPTVDLYFKAYNMKSNSSVNYKNYNSTGYNYGMLSGGLQNPFNLASLGNIFASPGSYGNGWVFITNGSRTWCLADKDGDYPFKPVVSIKTTAKIYKNGDDYNIIN